MDLRMPGMDGFETTERIRKLPDSKIAATKIVAFTGDVMKETVQQCLDIGMDGVIANLSTSKRSTVFWGRFELR